MWLDVSWSDRLICNRAPKQDTIILFCFRYSLKTRQFNGNTSWGFFFGGIVLAIRIVTKIDQVVQIAHNVIGKSYCGVTFSLYYRYSFLSRQQKYSFLSRHQK